MNLKTKILTGIAAVVMAPIITGCATHKTEVPPHRQMQVSVAHCGEDGKFDTYVPLPSDRSEHMDAYNNVVGENQQNCNDAATDPLGIPVPTTRYNPMKDFRYMPI